MLSLSRLSSSIWTLQSWTLYVQQMATHEVLEADGVHAYCGIWHVRMEYAHLHGLRMQPQHVSVYIGWRQPSFPRRCQDLPGRLCLHAAGAQNGICAQPSHQ